MMKIKQLSNNKQKIVQGLILTVMLFTIFSCRSQVTILSDLEHLKPTHQITNEKLVEILDIMITDSEFKNWQSNEDKMLLVSVKNDGSMIMVRAITSYRNSLFAKNLPNNYTGYFSFKNIFVVYYGDDLLFLKPTKNKLHKSIFGVNTRDKLSIPEYYGAEFTIDHDKVFLNEKNWFGTPVIN